MNEQLKDELLIYYGELMYEREKCNDYFVKPSIQRKLDAVNVLLGFKPIRKSINLIDIVKSI